MIGLSEHSVHYRRHDSTENTGFPSLVVEPVPMARPRDNIRQDCFADLERIAAEIVAIHLDQVERIEERAALMEAITDAMGRVNFIAPCRPPSWPPSVPRP